MAFFSTLSKRACSLLLGPTLILSLSSFADEVNQSPSAFQRANSSVVGAFNAVEEGEKGEHAQKAKDISSKVKGWMQSGAYAQEEAKAKAIYDKTLEARQESGLFGDQKEALDRIRKPGKVYVFLSKSMPTGVLRSLFQSLNDAQFDFEVELAFRGLFEGNRTFVDFSRSAADFVYELGLRNTDTNVGLNPVVFREYGVNEVPQLIFTHTDGSISRIKGSINIRSFFASLKETGQEFPIAGNTYKIAEKDFFKEIEERLAKIDFDKRVEVAKDNYWNKVNGEFTALAQSSEYKVYDVDMTVVVSQDIIANDGFKDHVIAKKGERFNPLDQPSMAAFNRNMIIFNPNSAAQLAWAEQVVNSSLAANQMPVLLLTEFMDGEREKTLEVIERKLNSHTYLADKRILDRFDVSAIPVSIRKSPVSGSMRVTQYFCEYDRCGELNVKNK